MNKFLSVSLIVATVLFVSVSSTVAGGGCGRSSKCGLSANSSAVSPEALDSYNKETLKSREQLVEKNSQIEQEYAKEKPDLDKISKLKKDAIDLNTAIQKVAIKYGVTQASCNGASKGSCSAELKASCANSGRSCHGVPNQL